MRHWHHIRIEGEVKGLARPRASSFRGHARMYDPDSNLIEKARIQLYVRDYFHKTLETLPAKTSQRGFFVHINAHFRFPKSMSKAKKALARMDRIRPRKKPDADNIGKLVLDALNGIVWEDDSMVSNLHVLKTWDETDYMDIIIMWLDEGDEAKDYDGKDDGEDEGEDDEGLV